jgi:hypothetical protein
MDDIMKAANISNAIKAYNGRITLPSSAKYLDGILTNLENLKFQ